MTDEVEKLASLSLKRPVRLFVDRNTDVAATLKQEFIRVRPEHENDREAMSLCKRTLTTRCLVFLPTKHLTHRLHICFSLLGIEAAELHGNLTQAQRVESLESFKKGDVNFLLATDLADRGLDMEGVRTVINYNMPATLRQYIHRVGRTAKAGRSGRVVSLVGEDGRKVLKEAVKGRQHQTSVKRVIHGFVIEACKKELDKISGDVERVLEEEKEEKEMAVGEMEIRKAENLMKFRDEISARPARTWFIQKNDSKNKPTLKPRNVGIDNKVKLASKIAKRYQKPKRLRVFGEEGKNKIVKKKAVKKIEKVGRNFHKQDKYPGKRNKFNKFSQQKKK